MGQGLADLLESMRSDVQRLTLVVERVRDLHNADGAVTPFCAECGFSWPCRTIRALSDPE